MRTQTLAMVQKRRQVPCEYLRREGPTRTVWMRGVDSLAIFQAQ
jgi:hypothetical protein